MSSAIGGFSSSEAGYIQEANDSGAKDGGNMNSSQKSDMETFLKQLKSDDSSSGDPDLHANLEKQIESDINNNSFKGEDINGAIAKDTSAHTATTEGETPSAAGGGGS